MRRVKQTLSAAFTRRICRVYGDADSALDYHDAAAAVTSRLGEDGALVARIKELIEAKEKAMSLKGLLIAGVGLPGSGKSTVLRELALKNTWQYLCEPEEPQWPLAVHNQSVSGVFTSLTWFRSMRVPNLYIADVMRKNGETVLIDSYYDKIMTFYLENPGMEWLISPGDPYYSLLVQMAHIDNETLPSADIIVFFNVEFDEWEKLIMTRRRRNDLGQIFPNAFRFQEHLMTSVIQECQKSGSQLVIFENRLNSVEQAAFELNKLLGGH